MTEQGIAKFKENIYNPYAEAWEIMKWMRDTEPKDDVFWQEYSQKATNFPKKYGNSEIAQSISRVILDAGTAYSKIVR